MKVEELIIDGFKSYATRTVISGWDSSFNAITGLNGSGKSNILDAICFVLGIASMTTVRASNLQDLIYKRGQAGVTKASVTIVFDNSDASKSPIGFENCAQISVTRQIILGGTSKYLVNGHKAQQQTVLNLFQSVQLNINNPNFLIMQGKITKVLNMKPTEILSLIEEAAGTRTFEERKEKAQRTMVKKEAKLMEIRSLLKDEIEPKLEKLRSQKRTFLEYQQTQTDLENLSRVLSAHSYVQFSNKFDEYSKLLNEKQSIMNDLSVSIELTEQEIKHLHQDLDQVKQQREEEMKKDGKIKELEITENQLTEELTRLNTSLDLTKDNLKDEEKKTAKIKNQITNLEELIASNSDKYNQYEVNFQKSKKQLADMKEEFNKKEELLSSLSTGISTKGGASGGYMAQLKEVKDELNETSNFIQSSNLKINHLNQQLVEDKSNLAKAKKEFESLNAEIDNFSQMIRTKELKLKELGYDPERVSVLKDKEYSLTNQLNKLNTELDYLRREVGNVDFQYSLPHPNFDPSSVKGSAIQLFNLQEQHNNKAMALQICAGGRLYNVVVDNSEVASQLLENGKLRKRVTIIPLDKINSRSVSNDVISYAQQLCPGQVEIAINLIDYDNDLSKAMEYIFGSTFICDSPDVAKAVTFDPKIRSRSITLEGDIYDPEGNLAGGSRRNTSSLLITMQKFNKIQLQINELTSELKIVQRELGKFQELSYKTKDLQNEINLQQQELKNLNRKLENNQATIIVKDYEEKQQEVNRLKQEVEDSQIKCDEFTRQIKVIEKDMKEFNTNKGSKLKELEKEVNNLRNQVIDKEESITKEEDEYQNIMVENDQRKSELENNLEQLNQQSAIINEYETKLNDMNNEIEQLNDKLNYTKIQLDEEKSNLMGLNEEMNELNKIIHEKTEKSNEQKLSIQKLTHEIEKIESKTKIYEVKLNELIEKVDWVTDGNIVENLIKEYPNFNIEDSSNQMNILQEKFDEMKRKVNVNIMNLIDNVEKKETSLKQMIKTIEKDKSKINNTIEKLNGYKRDTLNTTYSKVSVDFGAIFADLLPGSFAKLVPINPMDVTKGLEVKVKLGPVWKESLVELSGGQRSLIALSLIMALLQFKPAPMYILDEVDAALDLSHTQNIGHLIKTRFKGSQFIVVSLKEGMFTNANRVFRTRFQDGTSVVSAM
ncbi:structural maintenance of chromosomes protein 2 [[Candida] jaroonii]|uniref:Structural maintenance of chromosomes protein 2 n=1 Tax=[Candida] jaroonii TaxID=467808 RepID=A0ACA9Y2H0_9ASCO|nr:structural maintenance of chromosomes protein 2 [[Candida] jaroonii]